MQQQAPGTTANATNKALRGGAVIAVAVGIMNVSTYGFTIVAARLLGPQAYGAVASLMNVMLVLGVLQLALQAVAARRISANLDHAGEVEKTVLRVGWQASVGLAVLCLVLSPALNALLHLHSVATAALVGVAMAPLSLMGAQAGVLQGERRWTSLSLVYLSMGVSRLVIGVAAVAWHPTELSGMLGVTLSAFVPTVVGHFALRRSRPDRSDAGSGEHRARALWIETAHNGQTLLAFFALSNVDLLVARNTLGSHEAGLYAGGLILVKAGLFLPQFVVVMAFPTMSTAGARVGTLLKGLGLLALIGVLTAGGAAALSGLALIFVGGHQYLAIQHQLWVFAALGTLLSLLQLLVYSVLARQARRSVLLIWAALVVLVAVGRTATSFNELLMIVVATDATLFVALLALSLLRLRSSERSPVR
ncbi:lipopolysaccharide biosynthesis protein [Nocardioides terrisoli]|uniref:lipopolysaccharide biosynthesis protein n=1 Tax=Nocardioides terrisoli TaxID=3388267 RepID=UPI00287B5DD9|nr:polysaccharide biosynthesis protein [Nocardioides marmorisolisilvae]